MKSFIFKTFILVSVLIIGIILGMNQANKGMLSMKGYQDSSFQSPFILQQIDEGKIEATVMGNDVGQFDLEDRKEKLEEIKTYNILSKAGKMLANVVTTITQKTYEVIMSMFE